MSLRFKDTPTAVVAGSSASSEIQPKTRSEAAPSRRSRPIAQVAAMAIVPPGLLAMAAIIVPGTVLGAPDVPRSPIYGVALPRDYRQWELVAPAEEAAPLDELRVVLANPAAMAAYRSGKRPFPDGSVLVKLAWKRKQSADFATATVPGQATTVQVMVKDAKRYAQSGGWGYGRFVGGVPTDEAQHRTCFSCHAERVADRDFVFTRLAE